MNESFFRICAAVLFLAAMTISISFRSKADRDSGEKVAWKDEGLGMFLALRIGGLLMWSSIIAYLLNPNWLAWSKVRLGDPFRWAGLAVGLASVGLVYWLFRSIGTGISPTVGTRREHRLVTHGPYRWVRHPLYTAGTALVIALGLLADNWFIIVMAIVALILLAMRLPNEEAHLIAKFGDEYREYMKRTGRFLPRIL
jgi:protein-S-isoprenylcysteine O-methyltransferase Ste14